MCSNNPFGFIPFTIPDKWLTKTSLYMPPEGERLILLGEHYNTDEGYTEERYFEIKTPCCVWTGWNSGTGPNDGYGKSTEDGKTIYLHRRSYELANECVLGRKDIVDHLCRNHACWNPEHLERVTPYINIARGGGCAWWYKKQNVNA